MLVLECIKCPNIIHTIAIIPRGHDISGRWKTRVIELGTGISGMEKGE